MARQTRFWLLLSTLLVSASGASCPQMLYFNRPAGPRVLPVGATMNDVIQVVNTNTSRVQSVYTERATISGPLMLSLRAKVALERPRRLHLWADTMMTGPEVDLGSNDEMFWFWAKRMPPPAVFFCRHDQFALSAARNLLPVEPEWLFDAFGLTTFDPNVQHHGPTLVGGRLRIDSPLETVNGPMSKVTFLDESQGWILAQHLYDSQSRLVVSVISSRHWRDPATGAVLPTRIELQTPATANATSYSLQLDMHDLQVNKLPPSPQLWTMPSIAGYPPMNLADPNLRVAPPAGTPVSNGGGDVPSGAARPVQPRVRY